jgi:UDP-glucose 4-epimerase
MRILVTGGLGFVGGRLSRKLSLENEVIVSSRKQPEEHELKLHGGVQWTSHHTLFSAEQFPSNIDTVIHLAALNEWDSVKFPSDAIRVNIDETRQILENSINAGVRKFIYFSTAHIYGSPLTGRISESNLPVPQHPYAITHKAAEDYVIAATLKNKIKGIVIRLSNAFGAPVSANINRWTLLANDLSRQAAEKGAMILNSTGRQYRDFICLSDVEEVISKIVSDKINLTSSIYNLGSGKSSRVIDFASLISRVAEKLTGKKVEIKLSDNTPGPDETELFYSIDRLLNDGGTIKNDVQKEISGLLEFCYQAFRK